MEVPLPHLCSCSCFLPSSLPENNRLKRQSHEVVQLAAKIKLWRSPSPTLSCSCFLPSSLPENNRLKRQSHEVVQLAAKIKLWRSSSPTSVHVAVSSHLPSLRITDSVRDSLLRVFILLKPYNPLPLSLCSLNCLPSFDSEKKRLQRPLKRSCP